MNTNVPRGFALLTTLRLEAIIGKIAWSPEGRHLAATLGDSTLILEANTFEVIAAFKYQGAPTAISWSPNGMIAVGWDDGRIEIRKVAGGELVRSLSPYRDPISSLAWSPSGRVLASATGVGKIAPLAFRLSCWDTLHWSSTDLEPVKQSVGCLAWSPNDKLLLSCSDDYSAKLWNTETKKLEREFIAAPRGIVHSADWFPDGRHLVTGSHKEVIVWALDSSKPLYSLKGHTGVVTSISVSRQEPALIATNSTHGTIRLWGAAEWTELALLVEESPSSALKFHPTKPRLATVCQNVINIWDLDIDVISGRTSKPLPRSILPATEADLVQNQPTTPPQTQGGDNEEIYDLCIVCALASPELDKMRNAGGGIIHWDERQFDNDPQIYYEAEFTSKNGARIRVIASAASQMGLATTAVLTTKMIYRFLPKCVIMVGIAAGTKADDRNYGDILAANISFDYGSGKITIDEDGTEVFLPDFHPISIDPVVLNLLIAKQTNNNYVDEIKNKWPTKKPNTSLRLHIGPVGSGAAVLDSIEHVEKIRRHWRKLIGIEMEIYGVFSAGNQAIKPSPYFFAFKSVCDFAENKADDWQDYAAFTAAEFCYRFIVNDLWDRINKNE